MKKILENKKVLFICVDSSDKEKLEKMAKDRAVSMSSIVRDFIRRDYNADSK